MALASLRRASPAKKIRATIRRRKNASRRAPPIYFEGLTDVTSAYDKYFAGFDMHPWISSAVRVEPIIINLKDKMAKSQNSKKQTKKAPAKTAKEKKQAKRAKKG
ncbi:MAG: hypothetical protein RIQ93_1870 [Verrucomicrobiota bacterium]